MEDTEEAHRTVPKRQEEGRKRRKPPLSLGEVSRIIRVALGPGGFIVPSRHFEQRSQERDFTMQDALTILEGGTLRARPIWNERAGAWNYDVHGTDLEGETLTLRIAVLDAFSIILVTAFD